MVVATKLWQGKVRASMPWLYCHLKSSKGEGKNKADKTTRENPEIMGALEVPAPPWRTDRAL